MECVRNARHSHSRSSRVLAKGLDVDAARDGAEAVEKMLQHDHAVITLDLMMPRIDGTAVVRHLLASRPLTVAGRFSAPAPRRIASPRESRGTRPGPVPRSRPWR